MQNRPHGSLLLWIGLLVSILCIALILWATIAQLLPVATGAEPQKDNTAEPPSAIVTNQKKGHFKCLVPASAWS